MENKSRFSFLLDDDNNRIEESKDTTSVTQLPANAIGGKWSLLAEQQDAIGGQHLKEESIKANSLPDKKTEQYEKADLLKYRSEQLTLTKVNGIIENHAETKLEFHIKRYVSKGQYMADVHVADNVLTIYPAQLQEALNLVIDVDNVKCNALVVIDENTGKIKNIANMDDIRHRWAIKKQEINNRYAFVKSPEAKQNLDAFFAKSDELMTEPNILQDYTTRPFFDLFFDKYLVSKEIVIAPYTRQYYSQLFDRIPLQLIVEPGAIHESNIGMELKKHARLANNQQAQLQQIEDLYNQKYKNGIGYKFSEYIYEHQVTTTVDIDTNILESASMIFTEAVVNNIEITADYKLRRIH